MEGKAASECGKSFEVAVGYSDRTGCIAVTAFCTASKSAGNGCAGCNARAVMEISKSIVTSPEQAETCVSDTSVPGPCACVPPSHLVPAPRLSSYLHLFLSALICILATPSSLILV
ncbi:hypothetical protein IG631_13987 [Alternaria alternata]|jgi:hypothetical protein|nr:hypothetical protein IG631_13987 [Alternaria alternata]